MFVNFSNVNKNVVLSHVNNNESKVNSLKISQFTNENLNFSSKINRNLDFHPRLTESV